jgi:hypothetical protein
MILMVSRSTVAPKRSVAVEAKCAYGRRDPTTLIQLCNPNDSAAGGLWPPVLRPVAGNADGIRPCRLMMCLSAFIIQHSLSSSYVQVAQNAHWIPAARPAVRHSAARRPINAPAPGSPYRTAHKPLSPPAARGGRCARLGHASQAQPAQHGRHGDGQVDWRATTHAM